MRSVVRPFAAVALVLVVAACTASGEPAGSPDAGRTTAPVPVLPATSSPAAAEATLATDGGLPTAPAPTRVGTTRTDWGEILDAVPDTFPVFPDATVADPPPAPASGIWTSKARVDEVATWYRDQLTAANFASVDLGSALEDGSRIIDVTGDIPECKVQVAVRPVDGSTMITVFYGSGCAGGGG
jgi:hypothetical protein